MLYAYLCIHLDFVFCHCTSVSCAPGKGRAASVDETGKIVLWDTRRNTAVDLSERYVLNCNNETSRETYVHWLPEACLFRDRLVTHLLIEFPRANDCPVLILEGLLQTLQAVWLVCLLQLAGEWSGTVDVLPSSHALQLQTPRDDTLARRGGIGCYCE